MYTVPSGFMRTLRSLDRRLSCHYNSDMERFVVTFKRAWGKPIPLFPVQSETGGFRFPTDRDVQFLRQWDMENMTVSERLERATSYMEKIRERTRVTGRDNIRGYTKDDKIQLMNAFGKLYGVGKYNSAFRRITPKPKGEVFNVTDKRFHAAQGN